MECEKNLGRQVSPEDNCRYFERVSYSLIEEPEVCEWCIHFAEENSLCRYPETPEA